LIIIDSLNADIQDSAVYAPNKFADMTPAEFKKKMLMDSKVADPQMSKMKTKVINKN
jgi:hypothetical protein